jgi:hypothetical protein
LSVQLSTPPIDKRRLWSLLMPHLILNSQQDSKKF